MLSKPYLEVVSGDGQAQQFRLDADALKIGRSPDNQIVLDDERASRYHCVIEREAAGEFRLRDLQARNGTKVNNHRVNEAVLRNGDVIRIGRTEISFVDPNAPFEPGAADGYDLAQAGSGRGAAGQRPEHPAVTMREGSGPAAGSRSAGPRRPADPGLAFDEAIAAGASELAGLMPAATDAGAAGATGGGTRGGAGAATSIGSTGPDADYNALFKKIAPDGVDAALAVDDVTAIDALGRGAAPVETGVRSTAAIPGGPDDVEDLTEADLALVGARGQVIHPAVNLDDHDGSRRAGRRRGTSSDDSKAGLNVVRQLLLACVRTRATDLHIEPKGGYSQVRLRVDGTMVDALRLEEGVAARALGVIKVLADIDVANKLIVQEGHFSSRLRGDRRIDYRVSFTPAMHGQKMVIRVLDWRNAPQYLHELGLPEWMARQAKAVSGQESGMVLVCGPTGSGKTTTLYAVLREIDTARRNVVTIEDPVEYELQGVTQIPIQEAHGNTFHNLLRSVLRQDPDVILLGEIRDRETAVTAMQAAMTGHLVFTTLHARDTIGSIFRLLDLGVEPYLVASALNLVLAQRLIRVLCPHCKAGKKPTPKQAMSLGRAVEGVQMVYYPVGCQGCLRTGYRGRRAIFELMTVNDDLRDVILQTPTIQKIREVLKMSMFNSLGDVGNRLVLEGITPIEEVERVTSGAAL